MIIQFIYKSHKITLINNKPSPKRKSKITLDYTTPLKKANISDNDNRNYLSAHNKNCSIRTVISPSHLTISRCLKCSRYEKRSLLILKKIAICIACFKSFFYLLQVAQK